MLEKTILNVAINIFYLGPRINGVYWVRDFTIKLYRQVYSDLRDFFSTLASTVIYGSASYSVMGPFLTVCERDRVCLHMHNFMYS